MSVGGQCEAQPLRHTGCDSLRDSRLAALLPPETIVDPMMHLLTLASHLLRNTHLMRMPSRGSRLCPCKLGPLTTAGSHRAAASSPRGTCPCSRQYFPWVEMMVLFCGLPVCVIPYSDSQEFLLFTAVMVHSVAMETE